jgi:hypothetical protein
MADLLAQKSNKDQMPGLPLPFGGHGGLKVLDKRK